MALLAADVSTSTSNTSGDVLLQAPQVITPSWRTFTVPTGPLRIVLSFRHDPDATLDYLFDWTGWLNGDTITQAEATTDDAALTIEAVVAYAAGQVEVWVSGGTSGGTATLTCRIYTAAGRIDDRSIQLTIADQ